MYFLVFCLTHLSVDTRDPDQVPRDLDLAARDLDLAERDLDLAERDLAERDLDLAARDLKRLVRLVLPPSFSSASGTSSCISSMVGPLCTWGSRGFTSTLEYPRNSSQSCNNDAACLNIVLYGTLCWGHILLDNVAQEKFKSG